MVSSLFHQLAERYNVAFDECLQSTPEGGLPDACEINYQSPSPRTTSRFCSSSYSVFSRTRGPQGQVSWVVRRPLVQILILTTLMLTHCLCVSLLSTSAAFLVQHSRGNVNSRISTSSVPEVCPSLPSDALTQTTEEEAMTMYISLAKLTAKGIECVLINGYRFRELYVRFRSVQEPEKAD